MPICSAIITTFELQVADVTELSASEELSILNRVYQKICAKKSWEFLKTKATGSTAVDSTGTYITIPADFAYFAMNASNTNIAQSIDNNASPKVIFIFANNAFVPYQIVNYSDRRNYYNMSGYAYYDMSAGKIYFTYTPIAGTYEFDYIKIPATLTVSDTPIFPARFHDLLVYGMALENDVLQLSKSAMLYNQKNQVFYDEFMLDMVYWNALLQLN